jgi:hypothetical protein
MSFSRRWARSAFSPRLEHLEQREAPAILGSFAAAGASFNDATRALEGGLWQITVQESNQPTGTVARYVTDLTNVKDTLTAEKAANMFSGAALTAVNTVLADLPIAINNAPTSVAGGVAEDANDVHVSHIGILNAVNGNATLVGLANGGFRQVPPILAAGLTAATAPKNNLAQIGLIFNDAANQLLGGANVNNTAAITADLEAVRTGINNLRAAFPDLFTGLTGVHASVITRQIPLELQKGINEVNVNPVAPKFSNDIMLDIIDIIQGDTNLANMANQGGLNGFGVYPDALTAPRPYQDNQAQTNWEANNIVQSNVLGQAAVNLVTNNPGDLNARNALIAQLNAFGTNSGNFVASQGGLFEARFDNEFINVHSTNAAAIAATIRGLNTGNIALTQAGADQMHMNAADVAGNNIPVTGGVYNVDGTTIADVLSTAHA